MQLGHAFHHLMSQLHSGVPAEALEIVARGDAELAHWWQSYQAFSPSDLPAMREAERTRSTTLSGHRLEARYDLLAGTPGSAGRWVIVDWKTGERRPARDVLQRRLQTRIYPYVLVQAGTVLNAGVPIPAQQVEMLYWFAEFPAQAERFVYSSEFLAADAAFLEGLVHEIEARPEDGFDKAANHRLCRFCVYRSLCWEDVSAGMLAEMDDEADESKVELEGLDLDSVVPVPF